MRYLIVNRTRQKVWEEVEAARLRWFQFPSPENRRALKALVKEHCQMLSAGRGWIKSLWED
jgi:hypothetical protein